MVCSGKVINDFVSLSIAKEECKKDSICNGIFDVDCDGEMFWTCSGKMKPWFILKDKHGTWKTGRDVYGKPINKSVSSCAWEKGIIN